MEEETTYPNPSPAEPGTAEPTPPQDDTAEATPSNGVANSETQVAPASSDSSEATATHQVNQVLLTSEQVRLENGTLGSAQRSYILDSAVASDFQGMVARNQFERELWKQIPLPTRGEAYGTTRDLFALVRETIAEQTRLAEKDSALLAYWVFSSWLQDFLPVAPGISISGWTHAANLVLRTLGAICCHPILLVGLTNAALNNIDWKLKPTLIISEPDLSKRTAVFLSSSTCRGYLVPRKINRCPGYACDFYGAKAIYVGEDPSMNSMLQNFMHINASPTPGVESQPVMPMSHDMIQRVQNQLFLYRLTNLPAVVKSDFCASGLSAELNAIATALGKCIVDAPELQVELVSLLTPYSEQQLAERRDSLVMIAVGAALSLCHQGRIQVLGQRCRIGGQPHAEEPRRQVAPARRKDGPPAEEGWPAHRAAGLRRQRTPDGQCDTGHSP